MKLIKFLIKTILGIICLIVIFIVTLMILFSKSNSNPPLEAYENPPTTESIISNSFNDALSNMKDSYSIDISFDSNKLNQIIFNIIKNNFNKNYDPINGKTDEEKYINNFLSISPNVPLIGGKQLVLKNAYVDIKDDTLIYNSDIDLFGFLNSRIYIEMNLNSDTKSFFLTINKIKLGNVNLLNKQNTFALSIYKSFINADSINKALNEKNIPLSINLDDLKITCLKSDLKAYLKEVLNTDNDLGNEFINIILEEQDDLLNCNIQNNSLNLSLSLESLEVDNLSYDESIIKDFNKDSFIANKTQNLLLSTLTNENKIILSYQEFNNLIYTKTNGYTDLTFETIILDNITLTLKVDEINLYYSNNSLYIKLIIDILGLKTTCIAKCNYFESSDDTIVLTIDDTITLGSDLVISSSFLKSIMKNTFNNIDFLEYDDKTSSIIISQNLFNQFLSDSSVSTLKISKIFMDESGLSCIFSFDKSIQEKIDLVSKSLEATLENNTLDLSGLDGSDSSQKDAIDKINNSIDNITNIIKDPNKELTSVDTDELIESINNLSDENKEILTKELEKSLSDDDKKTLEELYNQLFK